MLTADIVVQMNAAHSAELHYRFPVGHRIFLGDDSHSRPHQSAQPRLQNAWIIVV